MSIFTQLLTGKDNRTHDVIRWLAVLSFLVGLGLSIYSVGWKNQPFDLQQFGVGMGAMFATVGAALKLKAETEPESKNE